MTKKTPREYAFDRFSEAYHDPNVTMERKVELCNIYLELCLRERVRPTNSWLNTAHAICRPGMVSA